jgi:hypothetical protein
MSLRLPEDLAVRERSRRVYYFRSRLGRDFSRNTLSVRKPLPFFSDTGQW